MVHVVVGHSHSWSNLPGALLWNTGTSFLESVKICLQLLGEACHRQLCFLTLQKEVSQEGQHYPGAQWI